MTAIPPVPTYPLQIDNDRTLYKVYNTTETRLAENNNAWSDEIVIVPVSAEKPEIWADNGFGNIEGELFYYDAVDKDENNRVYKLKRCVRNISGNTKYNAAGTWIRSFVVAQHHNQLVEAIFKIQNMILALEADVNDLIDQPITVSDCPEVNFSFVINEESSSVTSGTIVDYSVEILGTFTSYRIDFGDGTSSTLRSGTHTYVPNSNIDPLVIVDNNLCSVVVTPSSRDLDQEPQPETPDDTFLIPIPDPIDFPNLNFECPSIPETTLTLPPIIPPCLDLGPLGPINVPSVISIRPPLTIPSRITFGPVNIPSLIKFSNVPSFPTFIRFGNVSLPTLIRFGNVPSFPTLIRFGNVPNFPTVITITGGIALPSAIKITGGNNIPKKITITGGKIPSKITITGCKIPSKITVTGKIPSKITFGNPPKISIKWGTPPKVSVIIKCPSSGGALRSLTELKEKNPTFSEEQIETLAFDQISEVDLGLPTEIKILPPKDFPREIKFNSEGLNIPTEITLKGSVPNEIQLKHNLPEFISVKSNIPSKIRLTGTSKIPKVISFIVPKEFPKIQFDTSNVPESIKLVGSIPDTITVKSNIPSEIIATIKQPAPFELIYKGGPIPLQFDKRPFGEDGENDLPCFSLVPCPRK